MELTANEVAALTEGELIAGDGSSTATSFSIDSRVLDPGACFVALAAERDGHDFVGDAAARGATIALVARPVPGIATGSTAVVQVADPLVALGRLGARARDALRPDVAVVAITGSSGKTGTKDLTAAALSGARVVHASPGSYNNEAGVPLTLLGAPSSVDSVVLEMGARAPGDIAELCAIARPSVGVITNIGMAHAGPLGGPAGIARVKGELFGALPAGGVGVLDADDPATPGLAARTSASVFLVSAHASGLDADVRARELTLDAELRAAFVVDSPWGSGPVQLSVHGGHQVVNALLAATVALSSGVPFDAVVSGLESVRPAEWRMEVVHTPSGLVVLHDAYNANPSSTEAALRALAQLDVGGRRVAVLGEMRELGEHSEQEHARIGRLVAELGIEVLVAVGAEARPLAAAAAGSVHAEHLDVHAVGDAGAALRELRGLVEADDAVLVKGSRAVGLEQVADALSGPPSAATPSTGVTDGEGVR